MKPCLFVALLVLFSACQKNKPKELYDIKLGEEIRFEVGSDPTTPYYWEWTNEDKLKILKLKSQTYKNPIFENKLGFGGIEEWVFESKKEGTDTLKMKLRAYETDTVNAPVSDSIKIVVRVMKK